MISRCGIMRKKAEMSVEKFKDFWFYEHGPIAAKMKNMRRYEQHLIIDREQRHEIPRGSVEIDGYSELCFDNIYDMEEGVASLHGKGTADLANFVEDAKILIFVKKVDMAVPEELREQKLVKLMAFLTRADGVSAQDFQNEWWGLHAELVKRLPGYVGYAQNITIDRLIAGKHVPYEEVPVDGMVEFWFKDMEALNGCLASEAFAQVAAHEKTFLKNVTTYLCETANYPLPAAD